MFGYLYIFWHKVLPDYISYINDIKKVSINIMMKKFTP